MLFGMLATRAMALTRLGQPPTGLIADARQATSGPGGAADRMELPLAFLQRPPGIQDLSPARLLIILVVFRLR